MYRPANEFQGSQNSELVGSKRTAFSMALGEVEKPGEDPERTAGDWDAMRPFSPVFFLIFVWRPRRTGLKRMRWNLALQVAVE